MPRGIYERKKKNFEPVKSPEVEVAALNLKNDIYSSTIIPFESQFKPNGDLTGFDLKTILQNPQANVEKVYQLMAYYVASDPIFSSAIKNVLVPFSVTDWKLQGSSQKAKEFFNQYFEEIAINDLLYGIFYDLYLYGNVFLYRHENGYIQILPPHRIIIQDIAMPNEPVLAFKVPSRDLSTSTINEKFVKTLEKKYESYPPEIVEGIRNRQSIVQLDPTRCYTIQNQKSWWEKYSMPLGISLLPLFSKKNLISDAETAELSNIKKSILHVTVGNEKTRPRPNTTELTQVGQAFIDALNGANLAITTWDVEANWKYVDSKEFSNSIKEKYAQVNSQILSGLGLASVIVTGDATGSSFAAAQVNTAVASRRIMQNVKNVAQFFKKIMKAAAGEQRIADGRIPDMVFEKVDLQTNEAAMEEIMGLFEKGLIGYRTVFENVGLDYQQERDRKEQEEKDGDSEIFLPPVNPNTLSSNPDDEGGNPGKDDKSRKSDKSKSASGKAPKPSNPEGSE